MAKKEVEKAEKVKKLKPPKTVYGWESGHWRELLLETSKENALDGSEEGEITYIYTLTGKAVTKNGKLKVLVPKEKK
jgi:hypothetical protein